MAKKKAGATAQGDKRGAPRIQAQWKVDVALAGGEALRRVHTSNISQGGLMFALAAPASVPASLEVTLSLPDGRQITVPTGVRHVARRAGSSEFDVGVQFASLDHEQRRLLDTALAAASSAG
jgi:c-di-GMP-binding flagellar brake protein YcgR